MFLFKQPFKLSPLPKEKQIRFKDESEYKSDRFWSVALVAHFAITVLMLLSLFKQRH